MGSTTVERSFEVKVYDQGQDVGGTVDFTITADLFVEPLEIGGSTARLTDGTSESMPYAVRFHDPDWTITPQLWNASGRLLVIGRVVEVVLTEGGSPTTADVRRIGTVRSSSATVIELHLIDEAAFDRVTILGNNPTMTVDIQGSASASDSMRDATWSVIGVVTQFGHGVVSTSGDFVQFGTTSAATAAHFNAALSDLKESLSGSNVDGNFKTLMFEEGANLRPVSSFGALSANNPDDIMNRDGWSSAGENGIVDQVPDFWVHWPSFPGGTTNGRLVFADPGPPTTPEWPYLLEEPGIRDLLTAIMDGTYGGGAMRFALPSTTDLPNDLLGAGAINLAIDGPVTRRELLTRIAKYAGLVLWTDDQGRISPRPWPVPTIASVSTGSLYRFDGTTAIGPPTYDAKHSAAFNVWRGRGLRLDLIGGTASRTQPSPFLVHGLFGSTVERDETAASPITADPLVHEVDLRILTDSAHVGTGSVADDFLDATLGGLAEARIRGHATSDAPLPGALVIFDHDDLKGLNPATGARSGEQLARVADRRRVYQGAEVYYDYRVIFGGVA